MKTLGHLIRERRRELGLTQDDLSNDLGISQSYLAKIETDIQSPGIKTINHLAEVLEIPKEKIFQYDAKTKPLVSSLNQVRDYDQRWAELSVEMKNALLELVPFLEKYL